VEGCGAGYWTAIEFCVVALEILRALANKGYNNKSSDDGPACEDMGSALIVDCANPVRDEYYLRET